MTAPAYPLHQLVLYFLKLGTIGFGGPVALVEYMRRDLVDARGWITEDEYKEGLALSQLAPGPLAAQLAIYLGYVRHGIVGATATGVAFVLPSFVMVIALGWLYVRYGGLPWMQAVFYGVGPAVIGIIAFSAYRLTRKSIGKSILLWVIYVTAAAVTVITESEFVLLFLAAGVIVWLVRAPPAVMRRDQPVVFALPTLLMIAAAADTALLFDIAKFFTYAGAFVFGSGLAIVPFLYGGVVTQHGWLSEQQFVDAVAVAFVTPGPVVITTGFIGFLIAGFTGATVAALATFLPAYLLTILPAPYFRKYGKRADIAAFVEGVTTAAIGAISGAVIVLGQRSITDFSTMLIAGVALVLLMKWRIPEPLIVLAAAAVGVVLKLA
ncbi:MAG TPA: chromate transporter [Longimicrobiales bacterium]